MESESETEKVVIPKTLEKLHYYQIYYQSIYPEANKKGKAVLRFYLKKLSYRIRCLHKRHSTTRQANPTIQVLVNKEIVDQPVRSKEVQNIHQTLNQ